MRALALAEKLRVLLSGSSDKSVIIWELETGNMVRKLQGHTDSVLSVAVTDGD